MNTSLDHLLIALRTPIQALPEGRCLLATLESDKARRLKVTLQTMPDARTQSGLETMAVETIQPGPLSILATSGATATLLLTPALVVFSDPNSSTLRRLKGAPHPGPSFIGCLPGTTLDWAPPATMAAIRRLAHAAARHLDNGIWELVQPLSAHQRLTLSTLPQAGSNALAHLISWSNNRARIRLLVQDRAAAIVFQSAHTSPPSSLILAAVAAPAPLFSQPPSS